MTLKFNLKNRPRWNPYASETDKRQYIDSMFRWFEGFEKELQERLSALELMQKTIHDGHSMDRMLLITNIKEILGESEK